MALNPNPGVSEQVSDLMRSSADQNPAHVAVIAANTANGTQVHKHGQPAGPGSFTAHMVFHPLEVLPAGVRLVQPGPVKREPRHAADLTGVMTPQGNIRG